MPSGGVITTAGLVGFADITVLSVGGLQVGQELGIDSLEIIGAGRAAGGQDGVNDLLARGSLGDPEGVAGAAAGPGPTGAIAVTVLTSVGGAAVLAGHIPLPGRR